MIFLDTETTGFTGPIILIQWAQDEGPVHLHHVWYEPVKKTLDLLEELCNHDICAFNLSFDWFHINKLYNLLVGLSDKRQPPRPEEVREASCPERGTSWCLKPKRSLDLFLHTRHTEWQRLMRPKPVVIRRIPTVSARPLAEYLKRNIPLGEIYFYHSANGYQWNIRECDDPEFSDLTLTPKPSGGLKALAAEIFKVTTKSIDPPPIEEYSYNPYHTGWLNSIYTYIRYWRQDGPKGYAEDDVILLRRLYHHFAEPEPGDTDSELAACVGAVRWKGYSINPQRLLDRVNKKKGEINVPSAPAEVKRYLLKHCNTLVERLSITNTKDETLERLQEEFVGTPLSGAISKVRVGRTAAKELDILYKLVHTERFCPDFKVIGTKSSRMSGGNEAGSSGGSLNPQGINHDKEFRGIFTLAGEGECLSGGDFSQYEVTILDAAITDENLRRDLESGKKFHAVFGSDMHDEPYEVILSDDLRYSRSKTGGLAYLYGAYPDTVAKAIGVSTTKAEEGLRRLNDRYQGLRQFRQDISLAFTSLHQPFGVGTAITYRPSAEYVESLQGYRRYFTLENLLVRFLYELAQGLPQSFKLAGNFKRKNKVQTSRGAIQTAMYAAAFNLQAFNIRAALNHVIQSTGGIICKEVQRAVWDLQPTGVHQWHVAPMNLHDEIMVVHPPHMTDKVADAVAAAVEKNRSIVPLLEMDWKTGLTDWSAK